MEKNNSIYWREVIDILISKKTLPNSANVDFRNEYIDFKHVALLNRHGIRVPKHLVMYNDSETDFSDDPDVTDEDIETGKISWSVRANFNIEPEIKQWLKTENIELNTLIPKLMKNFYETMKSIKNKAAF